MTFADLAITAPRMYAGMAKPPIDGFANVAAWFKRVTDLPAWKETNPFE